MTSSIQPVKTLSKEEIIELWEESTGIKLNDGLVDLITQYTQDALDRWGWPYKPTMTEDQYPPVRQTFLGYYGEDGWMTDHWAEGFTPAHPSDVPICWISLNVLPTPDSK